MIIKKYTALIRVNGQNILPTAMLEDELPIYKGVWKEENIQELEEAGTQEIDESTEGYRLIRKFGYKAVEDVYQKDALLLPNMLKGMEVKAPSRAKKAAPAA